jgi:hypothetical protein
MALIPASACELMLWHCASDQLLPAILTLACADTSSAPSAAASSSPPAPVTPALASASASPYLHRFTACALAPTASHVCAVVRSGTHTHTTTPCVQLVLAVALRQSSDAASSEGSGSNCSPAQVLRPLWDEKTWWEAAGDDNRLICS